MSAQNTLNILICASWQEAPTYRPPGYKPIRIERAVIVPNRPSIALRRSLYGMENEAGEKYVIMLTGRIVRSLAVAIGDEG